MTESKNKWVKPELIVLVRNNPAEAVLGACKTVLVDSGPAGFYKFCQLEVKTKDWENNPSGCQGQCHGHSPS